MINLVLNRAVYGTEWRPAPPVITAARKPVKAPGALTWPNKTRDQSPTRLIQNMPAWETVLGRASEPSKSSDVNPRHGTGRDSIDHIEWMRKMGLL